jgi:hypothetical protein
MWIACSGWSAKSPRDVGFASRHALRRLQNRCGVRRRAPSVLVGAVLLTALIGMTAPSTAGAETIQTLVAPNGVQATLKNKVLKITNSTDQWVYGVSGDAGADLTSVDPADRNDPRINCAIFPPIRTSFLCGFDGVGGGPPFARPPGETLRLVIDPSTAGLSRLQVWMLDAKCVNDLNSAYGTWPISPQPRAHAAKLDECARDALGVPSLTETGAGGGKVGLMINGASAHWATRVFGGRSRRAVKAAGSGKTVAKIPPSSRHYPPFGKAIVTLPRSVKFLRAAWMKKGEKPILGPILAVRR